MQLDVSGIQFFSLISSEECFQVTQGIFSILFMCLVPYVLRKFGTFRDVLYAYHIWDQKENYLVWVLHKYLQILVMLKTTIQYIPSLFQTSLC